MSVKIVCHCPECPDRLKSGKPMEVKNETASSWVFQCRTCLNVRAVAKQKIGGTIGQGKRDDMAAKTSVFF